MREEVNSPEIIDMLPTDLLGLMDLDISFEEIRTSVVSRPKPTGTATPVQTPAIMQQIREDPKANS